MTYSLNTLQSNAGSAGQPRTGIGRYLQEFTLVAGLVVLLFWLLALLSYSPLDGAWSTSGAGGSARNWGGRLGAWIAELKQRLTAAQKAPAAEAK